MVRKTRVETYLHPDTAAQLEKDVDGPISEFIRNAVNEKLEREND